MDGSFQWSKPFQQIVWNTELSQTNHFVYRMQSVKISLNCNLLLIKRHSLYKTSLLTNMAWGTLSIVP